MTSSVECFEHLSSMRVLNAVTCAFTQIMGDWFYVIIIMVIAVAIYSKSESAEVTGVFMFIVAGLGVLNTLIPATQGTASFSVVIVYFMIMVMGLALPIAKLLRERGV